MQRIALVLGAIALVVLSGCQTQQARRTPPPAPQQQQPPRVTNQRPVRPLPPRTWYPPLEPLPPMPQPPKPAPQQPKPAPAPERIGTLVTASQIKPDVPLQKNRWKVIVVHHSADEDATPEAMDRYHRVQRGWKHGLGYHFVIGGGDKYPDGKIFVGNRWKKQLEGAHCASKAGKYFGVNRPAKFFNTNGIGICMIGNMETQRPTPKQLAALEQLTVLLCKQTGINPSYVYGHGEVTHRTQCPGKLTNMNVLRSGIAARYRQASAYAAQTELESLDDLPVFDEEELAVAMYGPEGADLALAATFAHEMEDAETLDRCCDAAEPFDAYDAVAMSDDADAPATLCAWPVPEAIEDMEPVTGPATAVAGQTVGSARVRVIPATNSPPQAAPASNGARVVVRPAPPAVRPAPAMPPQRVATPQRSQMQSPPPPPAYLANRGGSSNGVLSGSASAKVHVTAPSAVRPVAQPVHVTPAAPQMAAHASPRPQTTWPQPAWVQQPTRPHVNAAPAVRPNAPAIPAGSMQATAPVRASSAAPVVVRPAPVASSRGPAESMGSSTETLDGCWNGKCGLETTRRKRKDHWIPGPAQPMTPVSGGGRKTGRSLFGK
jgi:hypothetical protein